MTAFEQLQAKAMSKCKSTAIKMASLELSVFDDTNYQKELKQHFGFTDKKLSARKKELQKIVGNV